MRSFGRAPIEGPTRVRSPTSLMGESAQDCTLGRALFAGRTAAPIGGIAAPGPTVPMRGKGFWAGAAPAVAPKGSPGGAYAVEGIGTPAPADDANGSDDAKGSPDAGRCAAGGGAYAAPTAGCGVGSGGIA